MVSKGHKHRILKPLKKTLTGIDGLDEVTHGGLPQGRCSLVCGTAGSGKTLLAMEFIVRGATEYGEPGVFMAFEENEQELGENVASLGFDLKTLSDEHKLLIDYVHVERTEIYESGEYDLEAIFIRLGHAIDSIGAKRVVLDTIEVLFSGLTDTSILRAELRRLFRWLKEKGVTAIITAERGEGTLTRYGIEEYVSDCVISLDQRVNEQISTRRLRIVKYRGTLHGTNEYPFLIDEHGFSVIPITSLGLEHEVTAERVSSGLSQLDTFLGGQGYYRGSSVLISGTAGTGKSTLAAYFAKAVCERGERCLYVASEESPQQIIRNMRSIGVDLEPCVKQGLLRFYAARPTMYGLEMHLATVHKLVAEFKPQAVILDPITNLVSSGTLIDVKALLMRLVDYLKSAGITSILTSLTMGGAPLEQTEVGISSLIDTWLLLRDVEVSGERNRSLYVLKSRGMAHSNQIREFILTDQGLQFVDAYVGVNGVLTGTARLVQEAHENVELLKRRHGVETLERKLDQERNAFEAQVAALQAQFEARTDELSRLIRQEHQQDEFLESNRAKIAKSRKIQNFMEETKEVKD